MKKNIIVARNEKYAVNKLDAYRVGDICLCLATYDTVTQTIDDTTKIKLENPGDIHEAVENTEKYLRTMILELSHCTGVTNIDIDNGAVNIFLPGVAEEIAKKLDSDFYIVFTSIHDAVVNGVNELELKYIYKSANEVIANSDLQENELLTNHVYIYRKDLKSIELAQ